MSVSVCLCAQDEVIATSAVGPTMAAPVSPL